MDPRGGVLVTGIGVVGEWVVEFLARSSGVRAVTAADVNRRRGEAVVWRAAVGALHEGHANALSFREIDLRNVDATATLIREVRPSVILHAATLLPIPVMAQRLGPELFSRMRKAGFGAWLPLHLLLTMRLMQAVRQVEDPPDVIDFPFPDFVNPVLSGLGLAPLAGCGNVDNTAGLLRLMVAQKWDVDPHDVHVYMIAPHAVNEAFSREGSSAGHEYHCRVYVSGIDVTSDVPVEQMLAEGTAKISAGPSEARVASSGVKAALSILNRTREHMHAAGPKGLPGGYPVRLAPGKVEVLLPPGLDLKEAVRINTAGQAAAGIERIASDGTVYCTETAVEFMREEFGYDARALKPSDSEERANELLERFRGRIETVRTVAARTQ